MPVLTDEQVDAATKDLDGWERVDGALRRSVKFGAFLDGVDAVRRVAEHAEREDERSDCGDHVVKAEVVYVGVLVDAPWHAAKPG